MVAGFARLTLRLNKNYIPLFASSADTKNTKKKKREKIQKNRFHTNTPPAHDVENVRK